MTTEMSSQTYKNLTDFLIKHTTKNEDKSKKNIVTNTRIGCKEQNIYGGSYNIPPENWDMFMKLYYDWIFVKKNSEYLTEKQLEDNFLNTDNSSSSINGPILIDFDFRYNEEITERQHTKEHIADAIILYTEELKKFFVFEENKIFPIFIMEKPNVNVVKDKNMTKDGIHMLIGIQMDHVMQQMLRKNIVENLGEIWSDLPLTNNFDSILDLGISKGTTNWQLFGSKKPGNEAYELTQYYIINYDSSDGEFMIEEQKLKDFDMKLNFTKLSAQYKNNVKFEINKNILEEYYKLIGKTDVKNKKSSHIRTKVKFIVQNDDDENEDDDDNDEIVFERINNSVKLEDAIQKIFKKLRPDEYYIKEIHQYTQILPEKYYGPGSHNLNRQVAFALKHTDERLFLSWIQLRSKAEDFQFESISKLYGDWKRYFHNKENGVTKRSIIYWAKNDAREEYDNVRKNSIDYYLDMTIDTATEFDFAVVLYQMFSDKYVCATLEGSSNSGWYVFNNHRWELDKGHTLRLAISRDMYNLYIDKVTSISTIIASATDPADPKIEYLKKRVKRLIEISSKLKKTSDKNNIIRECQELFYDKDFLVKIDSNPYLLGCNNGIIDFKNKVFREGRPEDYVSKNTRVPYLENLDDYKDIQEEIQKCMEQFFPIEDLCRYMWDHASSTLIGANLNQTFNIYKGAGSNGKSKFTDLMSKTLGEYKGTVPLALITEKRGIIGGTSSEVMQLKGIRYAVMQELSKGQKLNEGPMKELTSGDPLQGRSLYCESEVFIPQFTLAVCTNVDFDIYTNDDGTWRRIRRVPYLSKFVDAGYIKQKDDKYIFPKDKFLDEKFQLWAPVFLTMLIQRAFETNGIVEDCDIVLEESKKYRESQDHIATFIEKFVITTNEPDKTVNKREIHEHFKLWFQENGNHAKLPKMNEINEYMDKRYKKFASDKGWYGCEIDYEIMKEKTKTYENDLV